MNNDTNMELGERIEVLEERLSEVTTQNAAILLQLQQLLEQGTKPGVPGHPRHEEHATPPISPTPPEIVHKASTLKPSPPNEFNGDQSKGRAFINSCELYIRLVPQQFADEVTMVHWALTFMKSGRAALFSQRVLRSEERTGFSKYYDWKSFRKAFLAEFCPKNETQLALAKLETSAYHQGRRSVDEYVDDFKELIDQAGYTEGLAIVVKFRRGLQREIQDQIAHLAFGRPGDDYPEAWYDAAIGSDENRIANSMFHGGTRQPPTCPLTMAPTPFNSGTLKQAPRVMPFWQERPTPAPLPRPMPQQNPAPMEIDAAKRKAGTPITCYRCGGAGHLRANCPQQFDIRFMTHEEREEYVQDWALQADAEETQLRAENAQPQEVQESEEVDFRRNSK
jgi:Retrotransposon gag protein/Zinc knuckle